ncbi:hypothetical protein [Dyadobacter psychrotolerans]|uniref:Uncharacterized protein n=1 Tax=Dyadobacter psychrotolerans TaxID=2541721 RepID=A0A4R5DJL5_9BACT|nr:hypothetical protein [Dyadobacter psychrotolerans]TDE10773.1 hypothetical protein E0F88_27250 [Dyadobacter psychrotolerans]
MSKQPPEHLSPIELEILYLTSCVASINEMVNNMIFELQDCDDGSHVVILKTEINQKYFNIHLVDLLTMPPGDGRPNSIEGLSSSLRKPLLNRKVSKLRKVLNEAVTWLDTDVNFTIRGKTRKLWFPTVQQNFTPKITRREAIVICGNISKHNHLVLSRNVKKIQDIFLRSDIKITSEEGFELIPEFYAQFHDDIFNYQVTKIVELLNNIRWEIYHYVKPFFEKNSLQKEQGRRAHYVVPQGITDQLIKHLFYDLLNSGAPTPSVERFKTWKWVKKRY